LGVEFSSRTDEYAWNVVESNDAFERVTVCKDVDSRSLDAKTIYARIDETLKQIKPDVVAIPGWSDNGAFATLRWCCNNGVPAILMSESNRHDFKRSFHREWIKKQLTSCFSSALVGGTWAREYLSDLGMPGAKIFDGYDIVDNRHFARPIEFDAVQTRESLGLKRPFILASNRFIEKKNLPLLIDAYAQYRTQSVEGGASSHDLVMLGDGPLNDALRQLTKRLGLDDCIHFPGFKQFDELTKYYWCADVFVHASTTEQWGLVINEAMAAGLPVIASNRCGSTVDLIENGKTGFTFAPQDQTNLTELLVKLCGDAELRNRISSAAVERMKLWGPERFADGMMNAVTAAIDSGPGKPIVGKLMVKLLCR